MTSIHFILPIWVSFIAYMIVIQKLNGTQKKKNKTTVFDWAENEIKADASTSIGASILRCVSGH